MKTQSLDDAKKGDPDAFQLIVEPFVPKLFRTASIVLLDPNLAKDALQEGLVRAFLSLRRFSGGEIEPWLQRLVLNEARRLYRREQRNHRPLALQDAPEFCNTLFDPESHALEKEERKEVLVALSELRQIHRTVLVLRYVAEYKDEEIARILGVRPGTVKSRLHNARNALRRRLERPIILTGAWSKSATPTGRRMSDVR